jgi:hypothetical protein
MEHMVSDEPIVVGLLSVAAACSICVRLPVPFGRCLSDLLEAVVLDFLGQGLCLGLFDIRDH